MDELLSLAEASEIMHVSYSKAQKLAKAGELPFRKLGKTWYRELGLEYPDGRKEVAGVG